MAHKEFDISGVDHIGLGVKSLASMRSYYSDILEFSHVFVEMPRRVHKPLEALLRMPGVIFSGVVLRQEAGGVPIELVEMENPIPRRIRARSFFGDIGINKVTIFVPDTIQFYEDHGSSHNFCSIPKSTNVPGLGKYSFVYCKDPEGNLIEFASATKIKVKDIYSGVYSIGVSVTDIDRSIRFYKKLGFTELIKKHDSFSGLVDEVSEGKKTRVNSCLLSNGDDGGKVELFEVSNPRGRSIPFSTNWGDFGYLQLCLKAKNVERIADFLLEEDIQIVSPPQNADDELAPAYMYFRDPDGILVEVMDFNT